MSEPLRSGPPPRGAQSRASACAAAATAGSVLSTLWTRPAPHRTELPASVVLARVIASVVLWS